MNYEIRKNRPKSQIMTLDSSSPPPPPQRKNGSLPQQQRWYENDGELKERQLSELKTRMRQMEKTMRWWSDCATNWREKWSQLRLERNQVKEELKMANIELENVSKELDCYRKGASGLCTPTPTTPNGGSRNIEQMNHFHHQSSSCSASGMKNKRIQTDSVDYLKSEEVVRLEKNITRYLLMLEEANRTIIAEREDKVILHHTVERLQRDFQDLQELYDNLKKEMYELKDYSEMDESYGGEHGIGGEDDGILSDEEDLIGEAVGYTPNIVVENGRRSPGMNYQTSLLIDLSERKLNELSSPPILQIVEEAESGQIPAVPSENSKQADETQEVKGEVSLLEEAQQTTAIEDDNLDSNDLVSNNLVQTVIQSDEGGSGDDPTEKLSSLDISNTEDTVESSKHQESFGT